MNPNTKNRHEKSKSFSNRSETKDACARLADKVRRLCDPTGLPTDRNFLLKSAGNPDLWLRTETTGIELLTVRLMTLKRLNGGLLRSPEISLLLYHGDESHAASVLRRTDEYAGSTDIGVNDDGTDNVLLVSRVDAWLAELLSRGYAYAADCDESNGGDKNGQGPDLSPNFNKTWARPEKDNPDRFAEERQASRDRQDGERPEIDDHGPDSERSERPVDIDAWTRQRMDSMLARAKSKFGLERLVEIMESELGKTHFQAFRPHHSEMQIMRPEWDELRTCLGRQRFEGELAKALDGLYRERTRQRIRSDRRHTRARPGRERGMEGPEMEM